LTVQLADQDIINVVALKTNYRLINTHRVQSNMKEKNAQLKSQKSKKKFLSEN